VDDSDIGWIPLVREAFQMAKQVSRRRREPEQALSDRANHTRARGRRYLIAAIVGALLISVGIVVSVFVILLNMAEKVKEANRVAAAVERASAMREGKEWTLNELFSYLEAKGVVSSMVVVERGNDDLPGEWVFKTADNRTVRVRRLEDSRAAAWEVTHRPGVDFSWGRFSFAGDRDAGDRFRRWLE
jgi:hypothetical protein